MLFDIISLENKFLIIVPRKMLHITNVTVAILRSFFISIKLLSLPGRTWVKNLRVITGGMRK